jgi:hypothetical protein
MSGIGRCSMRSTVRSFGPEGRSCDGSELSLSIRKFVFALRKNSQSPGSDPLRHHELTLQEHWNVG